MSELSKQALKVENNTSFPNNNNGQITPSDLRAFNVDMIDSTVNQTQYTSDSASWNQQIDALEQFTSSQQPSFNQLNAFTASQLVINTGVNSFTQSANGRLTALESETANLEAWTASVNEIADGGIVQGTSTRLHFAGLVSASIVPNVNGAIASILIEQDPSKVGTASFNAFTQSTNISINALNAFTSSVAPTSTGSLLVTASFNNGTRNLTFTKGDASTFAVNIPDVSGSTLPSGTVSGSSQINIYETENFANFNDAIAADIAQKLYTSSFNTYTQSNDARVGALESSASLSLTTASFAAGTLTFTKGNGTTFGVVIPDISGSTINTGSFATTGSNSFIGNQNVDGRVIISGSSVLTNNNYLLFTRAGGADIFRVGVSDNGNTYDFTVTGSTNQQLWLIDNQGGTYINTFQAPIIATNNVRLEGGFTASLQEGYAWVGNATNKNTQVPTSSFGSSINTGSFATTGSNTFYGDQLISGNILPLVNGQGDLGNDTFKWNKIVVNGELKGSSLNTTGRASVGTIRMNDEIFPLSFLSDREIVADGTGANTHMYYGTSSVDVNGLREFVYAQSGSNADFTGVSASFDTRINNIVVGTGFATTGSNTFFGSNTFNNSPSDEFRVNWGSASSASMFTQTSGGPNQTLNINSASVYINRGGLFFDSGSFTAQIGDMQFNAFPSASFTIRTQYGGDAILRSNSDYTNPNLPYAYFKATPNGGVEIIGFGNNVVISGSGTTIQGVDFIPFSASLDTRINSITGSGGSTNTGSLLVTASYTDAIKNLTFTKGDASTFVIQGLASTGSNNFIGVETITDIPGTGVGEVYLLGRSGSLILGNSTATPTYAALSHLSSSQLNGNTNLIFKINSNAGSTQISGSGNIFTNPTAPTTNYVRYVGGAGNIYLRADGFPQITASAASVSGNRPTMTGNMLGTGTTWNINQASNPGTHTYNNNILNGGTTTFNMLGNTGTVNFNNNIAVAPNFTINSPSRSIAEIQAGASGSTSLTISANIGTGTLQYQGPVSSSGTHGVSSTNLFGQLILNAQSASQGLNITNNIVGGSITLNDNSADIRGLNLGGIQSSLSTNNINGNLTLNQRGLSKYNLANNSIGGNVTISNDFTASGITVANQRITAFSNNLVGGTLINIYYSGSADGTYGVQRSVLSNLIQGTAISASVVGDSSKNLSSTAIIGRGLNVYGTSQAITSSIGIVDFGSAFVGRYNAEDGNRAGSAETIFAVGTGNSGSAGITRKTGFLIDSGSNTFVEGTLNVSGSSTLSGSLYIQSGSTLPVSTGSAILTWDAATGQVKQAGFSTIVSASVSSAEFWSTTTQSGSAGVSGSIQFNNSGSVYGVSLVNGTQLTVANAGVYNIQFSAQVETSAGADTVYIWFKKNGTNIGDSASKAVLANNTAQVITVNILDQAVANDYYEIAYQNLNGHATVLAEAASGNIPAIPSVIATVFQIR